MATFSADSVVSVLRRGCVIVGYRRDDFQSAVRGLLEEPLRSAGLDEQRVNDVIRCVVEREATGSTCTGMVALPHARIDGVPAIVAGLGIARGGIYPGGETEIMLTFVSPERQRDEHLRFLSRAARALRNASVLEELLGSASPGAALAALDGEA